jgi:hypothetical protein
MITELNKSNSGYTFIELLEPSTFGTVRAIAVTDCPMCNKMMVVDGYFSIGKTLPSGYKPKKGDLVKNRYSNCPHCNFICSS